jgi:hypothetical protein
MAKKRKDVGMDDLRADVLSGMTPRHIDREYREIGEYEEHVVSMLVVGGFVLGMFLVIKKSSDPKSQQTMNQNQAPFRPFNPQGLFRGGMGEQF